MEGERPLLSWATVLKMTWKEWKKYGKNYRSKELETADRERSKRKGTGRK